MVPPHADPFALDMAMVDALLDGRIEVDDAPPGFGEVVAVLRAADAPVRPSELDGGPEVIRRIFEEARRSPTPVPSPSAADARGLVRRWSLRGVIVAIVALLSLGGGVAMAATGNLPGSLQGAASSILGVVGVTVPDGSAGAVDDDPDPTTSTSTTTATDPDPDPDPDPATGPSTATDPTMPPTPTPTPAAGATPTAPPDGVPGVGDEVCASASDERCRAGEANPSVSAPGRPDDVGPPTTTQNPSVTAPGKPTTTVAPPVTQPTTSAAPPTTPPHPGPGRP